MFRLRGTSLVSAVVQKTNSSGHARGSRTAIRDHFRRRPATPTTVARTTTTQGREEKCSRHGHCESIPGLPMPVKTVGLVMPAVRGNPLAQTAKAGTPDPPPNRQQPQFSYLGVPAPASMSDWCESMSRTPIRDGSFPSRPLVSSCRRPLESPRTRHSRDQKPAPYPDTG